MSSSTSSSDLKAFVRRIALYGIVFLSGLIAACFFLPSKHARETMLGAQITKLKALEALPGERIIIVGGSGCGQGFVTSNICAALNRPAYNMGLHAGLGLIYQMVAVEPLIRKGDVVLLIPEYANFDGSSCFGGAELLMMVCDIIPEQKRLLSFRHWLHLLPAIPKYGSDKLRHLLMSVDSFDRSRDFDLYGDAVYPSDLSEGAVLPFPAARHMSNKDFSPTVLSHIEEFIRRISSCGGAVYVVPPAFQASSFERQKLFIDCIVKAMEKSSIPLIASPERYALDDKYFYDTPYHMNLLGRQMRTRMLVEDLVQAHCDVSGAK